MKPEFHPPHIYLENSVYFLCARTVHGHKFMDTNPKRDIFQGVMKEASVQYGILLYAWVILANHYHMLLKTSEVAPIWKFIKHLHGESAIKLNVLDHSPGRKIWYQYWDRFPRSEHDFWCFLNYIHINPIKHGYVTLARTIPVIKQDLIVIQPDIVSNVHQCLASYPYSSYNDYVREYGEDFLTGVLMSYPFPSDYEHDDFTPEQV